MRDDVGALATFIRGRGNERGEQTKVLNGNVAKGLFSMAMYGPPFTAGALLIIQAESSREEEGRTLGTYVLLLQHSGNTERASPRSDGGKEGPPPQLRYEQNGCSNL